MSAGRFLLVDAFSILHRAFYGLYGRQNLTAPDGTPTGALFVFFNMYYRFVEEIQPTHVMVAFDRPEATFRHDLFTEYKGTRKPMPDDLAIQAPLLGDILDALRIPRCDLAGYEADDLIGTYARLGAEQGYEVSILTGDKDSFQLVTDRISIVQPVTKAGRTEIELYDEAAIIERYGIKPSQFVDFKALMGDPSDNIPGVRGIGEKTAIALIAEFGTLENIYNSLAQIRKSQAAKLVEGRDVAYLSRELAQICQTAAVPAVIDDFRIMEPDNEEAHAILSRLGFRTLIDKLGLSGEKHTAKTVATLEAAAAFSKWSLIEFAARLKELNLNLQNDVAAQMSGLAVRPEELITVELDQEAGLLIHLPDGETGCVTEIRAGLLLLGEFKGVICGFDLKSQLRLSELENADYDQITLPRYHDVMISAYLLNTMEGRPDWPRLYERMTGKSYLLAEPVREEVDSLSALADPATASEMGLQAESEREYLDLRRQFLATNACLLREIALQQIEKTKEQKIEELTWDVEMPLVTVLAAIERYGVQVDAGMLHELNQQFSERIEELKVAIHELSGHSFNINSPKQLGEVLFDELGLPAGRRSASGNYSTSADILEGLIPQHQIVPLIIEYRMLSKLLSTFVEGLEKLINPRDNRVHTTLHQVQTATGRLSSTEPNLQNIPIRMSVGNQIRKAFTAPENRVLIDADYSQIELRLLAHLSADPAMIEAFAKGEDIHTTTAAGLFDITLDQVDREQRAVAKTVNFSIVYGVSDFGLARSLGIPVKEAHKYIQEYDARYPQVRKYLDGLIALAYEKGYVETLLGRRRYMHELKSSNRNQRNFGERAAMNMPLQGTAADLIKIAMVRLDRELRRQGLAARLILQVHDELIVEAPLAEAERVKELMRRIMENVVELKVPLLVDIDQGDSWYNCKIAEGESEPAPPEDALA